MSFEDVESGGVMAIRGVDETREEPSRSLAADIFRINTSLAAFQRLVYNLGTPRDTPHLRYKLHTSMPQIVQLLKETSAKLKQATQTHPHAVVSASEKISNEKLAKEFQHILKDFQKAQRLAAERESAYAPSASLQILSSSNSASEVDTKLMRSKEQMCLLVEARRQNTIVNVENEIVLNEAIIEEREQDIKEIRQQIGEVNEIFKDLAVLVLQQGAMIDDFNSNIDASRDATGQGTLQLTKASSLQRSNSSAKCLLLVIFGVILLILVVVVVA